MKRLTPLTPVPVAFSKVKPVLKALPMLIVPALVPKLMAVLKAPSALLRLIAPPITVKPAWPVRRPVTVKAPPVVSSFALERYRLVSVPKVIPPASVLVLFPTVSTDVGAAEVPTANLPVAPKCVNTVVPLLALNWNKSTL